MKMFSGAVKGIGALAVVWVTYINHTFTPLIWVLLALIFVDLVLNVHKEGQQLHKLGSMAVSIGLPTYVINNLNQPDLGKYLVAMLCIAYLQTVVPQLIQKVSSWKLSKDPAQNKVDQATIDEILNRLSSRETQAAQQVIESVSHATTGAAVAQPIAKDDTQGGV